MGWFFNQWVYGTEIPKLAVKYRIVPNEKGAMLEGTITQQGVSKEWRTFLPAAVTFGQNTGTARLVATGPSTPFSLQLPKAPDNIEFNPLGSVLCDLEVKKM